MYPIRYEKSRTESSTLEAKKGRGPLGVLQSTTRGGDRDDNQHTELFLHSLKAEIIHVTRVDSERSLRAALEEYVPYYNCKRLHSPLGYRPPAESEAQIGQK